MLDKLRYTNHRNQSIDFGSGGIFITSSDLKNYEWNYSTNFGEITNFEKKVTTKKAKIIIIAGTNEEGIKKKNAIFKIFDADVLANQPGKLYDGDYYISCYVVASKKEKWYLTKRYLEIEVTFAIDRPDWIRERELNFLKAEEGSTVEMDGLKKVPYRYSYYYLNQVSSSSISNDSLTESDFILRIYGAVSKPLVNIGANSYQVNISLSDGERLEIDSKSKTVKLVHSDGYTENVLWSADKNNYIFQKIPTGAQLVTWDGSFAFDLVIVDKRSEPLWT